MDKLKNNAKVREWNKSMEKWQTSLVPGATSSNSESVNWWKPLDEVFHAS